MSSIRVRSGNASVTVGPELERRLNQVIDAALGPEVRGAMVQAAERIAQDASASWYSQVDKKTGQSGRWTAQLSVGLNHIASSVVSEDERTAKGKAIIYFIHRPGPFSQVRRGGKKVKNPKAGDGKFLVSELIRKPGRKLAKALVADLGAAIIAAAGR